MAELADRMVEASREVLTVSKMLRTSNTEQARTALIAGLEQMALSLHNGGLSPNTGFALNDVLAELKQSGDT